MPEDFLLLTRYFIWFQTFHWPPQNEFNLIPRIQIKKKKIILWRSLYLNLKRSQSLHSLCIRRSCDPSFRSPIDWDARSSLGPSQGPIIFSHKKLWIQLKFIVLYKVTSRSQKAYGRLYSWPQMFIAPCIHGFCHVTLLSFPPMVVWTPILSLCWACDLLGPMSY